jgi:hypothetical protein
MSCFKRFVVLKEEDSPLQEADDLRDADPANSRRW